MKPKNNDCYTLDNLKINVKHKLSALWVAVMFIYVYADIKVFFQPGIIDHIRTGKIASMEINQIFLLCSAIIMTIPSLMIFFSLTMKPRLNRTINIIFGLLYTLIIGSTYLMSGEGEIWAYYIFFNLVEIALTLLIVWHAWRWPEKKAQISTLNSAK